MLLFRTITLTFILLGKACAAPVGLEGKVLTGPTQKAVLTTLLTSYAIQKRPTAIVIVRRGADALEWGDTRKKVNIRSVRKSILSVLFGTAVSEGRINIRSSLKQLGIDDTGQKLSELEKQATVRDLLMARSGIYHQASSEMSDVKQSRPRRGSHAPGQYWFYNNWDFNVLGTIYRTQTGEDLFESFERRIARPLGMQDFSVNDGQYILDGTSIHPAYRFKMSARDLVRFGRLVSSGGMWNGMQIVPSKWIRESTTSYSQTDRDRRTYGYMWWVLPAEEWGEGAVIASGYGGQIVAIVPKSQLVAVQTVDLAVNTRGIRTKDFLDLLSSIITKQP